MVGSVNEWFTVKHALEVGSGRGILLNVVATQMKKDGSSGRVMGLDRPHHRKRVWPSDGGRELLVGDGGVVGREVVASEAERVNPNLDCVIDGGEWVEDGVASAAVEGGIGEDGHGGEWLDQSVDGWVARWKR
ncbi:hypothetical protein ACFXTH_023088 [Malus domestica]